MLLSIALDGALPGNAVDAARFVRISANADSFNASTWNNGGRLLYLEVTGALSMDATSTPLVCARDAQRAWFL